MRFRTRVAIVVVLTAISACGEDPTAFEGGDLTGSWFVSTGSAPTFYGLTSAQIAFRSDRTFRMVGESVLSESITGEFDVEGTWDLEGDRLVLVTGDGVQVWSVIVRRTYAFVSSLDGSIGFQIHRALPD